MKENNIKKLEMYGEVDYATDGKKICLIEDKFKRGTIKQSAFSGELRLLNDKYGMYQNIRNCWQLCEIKKVDGNGIYDYYETKHIEELTLDKLFEIVKDDNLKTYLDEQLKEYYKKNRFYYELDINNKKSYNEESRYIHFYVEVLGTYFEINIDSNRYVEILSKDFQIYNDYANLKESFDELINKEITKFIGKDIIKLENGYVYKNIYYEDFEEIKEIILGDKECIEK